MLSLLQRLKERKLFQWALAYLAGAWLAFQGIEVLAEPWGLSVGLQRNLHVLLGFGFIITLVLAWYHGERGRQRIGGIELLILAAILIVGGAVLAALGRGEDERGDAIAARGRALSDVIDPKSVAVLPFANLSADPDNEYFSDGISADIINRLAKVADLKVIARTSVVQYKGTEKPIREIGRELGVATIVEGEVQRSGGHVRINAQLIDADSELHLWADTYDRELTAQDVFAIQSEIAEQIASALRSTFTFGEKDRVRRAPTENLEAYDLYLRGQFAARTLSEKGVRNALAYFDRALEQDSTFAQAYAGIAETYVILSDVVMAPNDALPRAKAAALKALEFDPDNAEARAWLGIVLYMYDWDYSAADDEYRRALELNPNSADARFLYAFGLCTSGRTAEGLVQLEHASAVDPFNAYVHWMRDGCHLMARDYDRIIEEHRESAELDPDFFYWDSWLAIAYREKGLYEESVSEYRNAQELMGQVPLHGLAVTYARMGRTEEARRILEELHGLARETYVAPDKFAMIHAALGENDQAFEWLERAREAHSAGMMWLDGFPEYDSVRSDPRFEALLRRLNYDAR
jgi:TolB-like protein/Tfp pilus assembly protein PilF